MNLIERISYIQTLKTWQIADVARAAGVSTSAVSQWLGRGSKEIKSIGNMVAAANLAKATGLSAMWIAKGLGAMRLGSAEEANHAAAPGKYTRIPLISLIQASIRAEIAANFQPNDALAWIYTGRDVKGSAFALTIRDDSMYNANNAESFKEGDIVIIDPELPPKPGSFVAARKGTQEATFKKYRPRGFNDQGVAYFELHPLNPDHPPIRSDMERVQIIGTAIEHHRKIG